MSATIVQFPATDRPRIVALTDQWAFRRVAEVLRGGSVTLPTDSETEAAHWMAMALEAVANGDNAEGDRCMRQCAKLLAGVVK